MLSFHELASRTEVEFLSLVRDAWKLESSRVLSPETFKGGFELLFSSEAGHLSLRYSDMEFEARLDGAEVFGASQHPTFSGNMFSLENLAGCLPRILEATVNALA